MLVSGGIDYDCNGVVWFDSWIELLERYTKTFEPAKSKKPEYDALAMAKVLSALAPEDWENITRVLDVQNRYGTFDSAHKLLLDLLKAAGKDPGIEIRKR